MRLDLNTRKQFLGNFGIFDHKEGGGGKGKISKFEKIQIFEYNLIPNYSAAKKFQMRKVDMNTKK